MKTVRELVEAVQTSEGLGEIVCKAQMSPVELLGVFAAELAAVWDRFERNRDRDQI